MSEKKESKKMKNDVVVGLGIVIGLYVGIKGLSAFLFEQQAVLLLIDVISIIVLLALFYLKIKQGYEKEQELLLKKSQEFDIAQKDAEESRDLLVTLKDMQSSFFLEEQKLEESFDKLLGQLLHITNSEYGFIGEVMFKDGKTAFLKTHAVVDTLRKGEDTLSNFEEMGGGNLQILFEHVMRHGSYVISNKVPEGHPELKALLGFPVMHHDNIVGMVGVSNRNGYEEELVEFLTPFLSTYGTIIQNIRLKRVQHQYEEELFQAKEIAEQAVRDKAMFLTNISHELRTPLTLITGPVSAILKQPEGTIQDHKIRPSLEMTLKNSNKMLQFIEDIMDLAKLSSNKLEVHKSVNNMYAFIEGIYSFFKIQTTYRKIDYRLEYTIRQDIVLEFDTRKVEKIVNNLLSNAFKYTKDGGEVVLSVSEVGESLKVEVRDTGVGINKEDLERIFDRFYQTNDKKKTIATGTGVGLALAQDLAKLQGFTILATSIEGKGSCFSFLMPLLTEEEAVEEAEVKTVEEKTDIAESSAKYSEVFSDQISENETTFFEEPATLVENTIPVVQTKPSVLVVEDNYDMRTFIKGVLEEEYEVTLAENGAVGLALLEANHQNIDLVITDLMMPEMDGFELLENVKSKEWGVHMPVIVLTAKTGEESKIRALTIGVDEYLTKPFSVDELLIRAKNLLSNLLVRKEWLEKKAKGWEGEEEVTEEEKSKIDAHQNLLEQSEYDQERIEKAKAFVEEHIDDVEVNVDDLARALIMSKRQLYRFMQTATGLTPLNFIKEIRLQEARKLLENRTCKTVKEVSYSIGFMSTRHFTKNYLERFGKKPSAYFK